MWSLSVALAVCSVDTWFRSGEALDDSTAAAVSARELDHDSGSADQSNDAVAGCGSECRLDLAAVVETDAEHGVRQHLLDHAGLTRFVVACFLRAASVTCLRALRSIAPLLLAGCLRHRLA